MAGSRAWATGNIESEAMVHPSLVQLAGSKATKPVAKPPRPAPKLVPKPTPKPAPTKTTTDSYSQLTALIAKGGSQAKEVQKLVDILNSAAQKKYGLNYSQLNDVQRFQAMRDYPTPSSWNVISQKMFGLNVDGLNRSQFFELYNTMFLYGRTDKDVQAVSRYGTLYSNLNSQQKASVDASIYSTETAGGTGPSAPEERAAYERYGKSYESLTKSQKTELDKNLVQWQREEADTQKTLKSYIDSGKITVTTAADGSKSYSLSKLKASDLQDPSLQKALANMNVDVKSLTTALNQQVSYADAEKVLAPYQIYKNNITGKTYTLENKQDVGGGIGTPTGYYDLSSIKTVTPQVIAAVSLLSPSYDTDQLGKIVVHVPTSTYKPPIEGGDVSQTGLNIQLAPGAKAPLEPWVPSTFSWNQLYDPTKYYVKTPISSSEYYSQVRDMVKQGLSQAQIDAKFARNYVLVPAEQYANMAPSEIARLDAQPTFTWIQKLMPDHFKNPSEASVWEKIRGVANASVLALGIESMVLGGAIPMLAEGVLPFAFVASQITGLASIGGQTALNWNEMSTKSKEVNLAMALLIISPELGKAAYGATASVFPSAATAMESKAALMGQWFTNAGIEAAVRDYFGQDVATAFGDMTKANSNYIRNMVDVYQSSKSLGELANVDRNILEEIADNVDRSTLNQVADFVKPLYPYSTEAASVMKGVDLTPNLVERINTFLSLSDKAENLGAALADANSGFIQSVEDSGKLEAASQEALDALKKANSFTIDSANQAANGIINSLEASSKNRVIVGTADKSLVSINTVDAGGQRVWKGLAINENPVIGIDAGGLTLGGKNVEWPNIREINTNLWASPGSAKLDWNLIKNDAQLKQLGLDEDAIERLKLNREIGIGISGKKPPTFTGFGELPEVEVISKKGVSAIIQDMVEHPDEIAKIGGSVGMEPQLDPDMQGLRGTNDIDLYTKLNEGGAGRVAQRITDELKITEGADNVRINPDKPMLVETRDAYGDWQHAVDIHAADSALGKDISDVATNGRWGVVYDEGTTTMELPNGIKVRYSTLAELTQRKLIDSLLKVHSADAYADLVNMGLEKGDITYGMGIDKLIDSYRVIDPEGTEAVLGPAKVGRLWKDVVDSYRAVYTFQGWEAADKWAVANGFDPSALWALDQSTPKNGVAWEIFSPDSETSLKLPESPRITVTPSAALSKVLPSIKPSSLEIPMQELSPKVSSPSPSVASPEISPSLSAVISPSASPSPKSPSPYSPSSPSPSPKSPSPSPSPKSPSPSPSPKSPSPYSTLVSPSPSPKSPSPSPSPSPRYPNIGTPASGGGIPLILVGRDGRPLSKEQLLGSMAWKQGFMYKLWYPPYGQDDIINSRTPFPGVKNYQGFKSAYASLIRRTPGTIPPMISRNMGMFSTTIVGGDKAGSQPQLVYKEHEERKGKGPVRASLVGM
jgi:hypothetical protein